MGRDDLFRRSFEAGTAFWDMTRERAEALVKELVKAGEVQKGKAQKVIDEVLERSRKGSEELRQLIRREITEQVSALGLATKDDVTRLEERMAAPAAGGPTAAGTTPGGPEPMGGAMPGGPEGAAADMVATPESAAAEADVPAPVPQPSKAAPVKKAGGKKGGAVKKAAGAKKQAAGVPPEPEPVPPIDTGAPPAAKGAGKVAKAGNAGKAGKASKAGTAGKKAGPGGRASSGG